MQGELINFILNVVAYILDNENKMKLTRQLLETHYKEVDTRGHNLGLVRMAVQAHYLNLVEKEVTPRTVLSHLVEVAKYFRNHHQPEGWLREKGGKKPQLPNDTRWNSQCECVDTFIQNFPLYIEIRNKHSAEIANNIAAIIDNLQSDS
ncbi:hypothetical protein Avbf_18136 [Armadillidium vulgare]|nr:hypothetical protein Avbf_18136 [Armadillidium vulgare]